MADPVLVPAAVKSFIQGVRFFRGILSKDFTPIGERPVEEIIQLTKLPASAGRARVSKDFPAGSRRAARERSQSAARSRGDQSTPAAEPIPQPETVTQEQIDKAIERGFEMTPIPTIGGPAAGVIRRVSQEVAKKIRDEFFKSPGERGREQARKDVDRIWRKIEEQVGRPVRPGSRQPRDLPPGNTGVIQRPPPPRGTRARTTGRGSTRRAKEPPVPTPVQAPPGVSATQQTEIARESLRKFENATRTRQQQTTPRISPFPIGPIVGLAAISTTALVLRQTGGTFQGGQNAPLPKIPGRSSPFRLFRGARSPANRRTPVAPPTPSPTPPFVDPITPTIPIPGVTTQTSSRLFSRQRQRTKECQEVLRRRRRKGECREGFFEELPGRTRFTTWRTVDCKTGKTIKRKK